MHDELYQLAKTQLFKGQVLPDNADNPDYEIGKMHRVFVYGSIKQGFGNDWLVSESKLLARTITRDAKFGMISMINYPAVVAGDQKIFGELYEVNGHALEIMDLLEGNGHFYQRQLVHLENEEEPAWMFCLLDLPDPEETYHFGVVNLVKGNSTEQEVIALFWKGLTRQQIARLMGQPDPEEDSEDSNASGDA